jgi:5-methylcytosine-specific restriction endonuclease McrA
LYLALMGTGLSTRLCCEPGCGEVGVDVSSGWRCSAHRRSAWDRWRASNDPAKSQGYGHRWAKFKERILRERGARCEFCGAIDVPLSLHHLDHLPPSGPRGYDADNVKLACTPCHVRESRRRRAA